MVKLGNSISIIKTLIGLLYTDNIIIYINLHLQFEHVKLGIDQLNFKSLTFRLNFFTFYFKNLAVCVSKAGVYYMFLL